MDENVKMELLARMEDISIDIDDCMTLTELRYFIKGYEYCRNNMFVVVNDICRDMDKKNKIAV